MVSKPTNNQGVIATMEMTQAHGERPSANRGNRLSSDAVDVEKEPTVRMSTPATSAKARMSWMLLAKSMPRKFMYPKNRKAQVIMASSPAYTSQPATLYRYPTSNTPGSKARLRRASAVPLAAITQR